VPVLAQASVPVSARELVPVKEPVWALGSARAKVPE
jgi:hypothetical protein